MALKIQIKLSA